MGKPARSKGSHCPISGGLELKKALENPSLARVLENSKRVLRGEKNNTDLGVRGRWAALMEQRGTALTKGKIGETSLLRGE